MDVLTRCIPVLSTSIVRDVDASPPPPIQSPSRPTLTKYFTSVYGLTTLQSAASIAGSYAFSSFSQTLPAFAGYGALALGSAYAFEYYTQKKSEISLTNSKEYKKTARLQKLFFAGTTLGLCGGLSFCVPLFPPSTILTAFVSTSVIGATTCWYGFTRPPGGLSHWKGPLLGGLLASLGLSVGSLCLGMPLPSAHHYFGVALFSGLFAYDTNKIVTNHQEEDVDVLRDSMSLYLNFINMFLNILKLLKNSDSDSNSD